jgi:hypothetical protein
MEPGEILTVIHFTTASSTHISPAASGRVPTKSSDSENSFRVRKAESKTLLVAFQKLY